MLKLQKKITTIRYQLDLLLRSLDSFFMWFVILFYTGFTYLSILAYNYEWIDAKDWENIHFNGVHFLFLVFLFNLRKKYSGLVYSIAMGLFSSRFINQFFFEGFEPIYELPLILTITIISYVFGTRKTS